MSYYEGSEFSSARANISKGKDLIDAVKMLSDMYLSESPMTLRVTTNFDRTCPLYEVSLDIEYEDGSGYTFPIYGLDDLKTQQTNIKALEMLLRNKLLSRSIYNTMLQDVQEGRRPSACLTNYKIALGSKYYMGKLIRGKA